MNPVELVTKLMVIKAAEFADADAVRRAIAAFLANLAGALKIPLPKDCLSSPDAKDHALFYAGVIVGHAKEIATDTIREAHLAMMFPGNRAILSRLLYGPGMVTSSGVPSSYGVS